MSVESYRNRRGRQLHMSDEELSSLHIDDESARSSSTTPLIKRRRSSQRRWRVPALITAVVITILAIGYVLGGEYLRMQYEVSTRVGDVVEEQASQVLQAQRAKTIDTAALFDKPLKELKSLQSTMCPGGFLDNAAMYYVRAAAAREKCLEERGKLNSLIAHINTMRASHEYLIRMKATLKAATGPREGQFAVISAQMDIWKNIHEKLKGLGVPTHLRSAHEKLVNEAKNIHDQWSSLAQANTKKDGEGFKATQKKLGAAYLALNDVAQIIERESAQIQYDLSDSYQALR